MNEASLYPNIIWYEKSNNWVGKFKSTDKTYQFNIMYIHRNMYSCKFGIEYDGKIDTSIIGGQNTENAYIVLPTIRDVIYDFFKNKTPNIFIFDSDSIKRNRIYESFVKKLTEKFEYNFSIEEYNVADKVKTAFIIYKRELNYEYVKLNVFDYIIYGRFENNNMKHLQTFDEKFDFNELIGKLSKIFSKKDLEKMRIKLIVELQKYKEAAKKKKSFTKDEIKEAIKIMKGEFGKEIVEYLNLDTFLNGLYTISLVQKNKNKRIDTYFNEYIQDLPERLKDIREWEKQKDKDRFYDDEEFQELMKLKAELRPKLSKKEFTDEKRPLQVELLKMIEWLRKSGNKIVLVFEGRDAAGKGSAIKNITEFLPPKQFKIATFDVPTEEEKQNWFKRYIDKLPKPGQITFYDRSWYNRAVNDPVMGYCTFDEYERFMTDVIPFEKNLSDQGFIVLKFWFSINKDIQELRFKLRQANPLKYWKFSENDLKTMTKWEQFTEYKERMLRETAKPNAPWVVVDSNDKRTAQLNVMRYILSKVPYDKKDEELVNQIYPEVIIEIE